MIKRKKFIIVILSLLLILKFIGCNKGDDLFEAVKKGNAKEVKYILDKGVNVNITDKKGNTPLIWASYGNPEIVCILLQYNANINVINENGKTALSIAKEKENYKIVRMLNLIKNSNNNKNTLFYAAKNGYINVFKLLVSKGHDVNAQNEEGLTPLMLASIEGHTKLVEFLISEGCDVSLSDNSGGTALMWAMLNGKLDIVKLILKNGPKFDFKDRNVNWSELDLAVESGNPRMVKLLLNEGLIDTNSALIKAAEHNKIKIIKNLLKIGADVNSTGNEGITPLMAAAANGNIKTVKLLIKNGADVNAVEKKGNWTVLDYAQPYPEIIKVLKYYGAKD